MWCCLSDNWILCVKMSKGQVGMSWKNALMVDSCPHADLSLRPCVDISADRIGDSIAKPSIPLFPVNDFATEIIEPVVLRQNPVDI